MNNTTNNTTTALSVVGLGKLGLCLAVCLAERGFDVLGVDIDPHLVDLVNRGIAPWHEPGLADLLARHAGHGFRATTCHADASAHGNMTFVLVPTPSAAEGDFSNRFIASALTSLAQSLTTDHLFVISSTVFPGAIEGALIPLIERASGRRLNEGFDVCYAPDFVALGNCINGFLRPDLVVIGESAPAAGARVESVYRQLCVNQPVLARMSLISAEVAKVSLNTYITMKISFANTLANLCERIPGADVDAITQAIGADRRISPHYFRGGTAFGGTCFPRDVHAFTQLAASRGAQSELIAAIDRVNTHQQDHLAEVVLNASAPGAVIGVIGAAFTSGTPVITESAAVKLIPVLLQNNRRVVAQDALALAALRALFGDQLTYAERIDECLAQCSAGVLTLRSRDLAQAVEQFVPATPLTLIDPWRQLDPTRLHPLIRHAPLGRALSA